MDANGVAKIVRHLTRGIRGRVKGMIRRGTAGTVNPATKAQSMQVGTTKDDDDDGVEYFEPYGFTSSPPVGSEGLILRVGGERAGSVAICFGNRTLRLPGVLSSEVAMYHSNGASIVLRTSGAIEVTPAPGQVVQLGGPTASLAVARETDPVAPNQDMIDYMAAVVAALTTIAAAVPVVITAPIPPAPDMGIITSGGEGSTST